MCIHHLSKLVCRMHSWKRYRQVTLSFNDSNVSPENRWSKFFSNFPPTTQHNHKGNHGSFLLRAMVASATEWQALSKAQASLFTLLRLLVTYPFPRALSFAQIVLYSYTISGHRDVGGKQKLLAKLWEGTVIFSIFHGSPLPSAHAQPHA